MKIKYSVLAFSIAAMAFLFLSAQNTSFAAGLDENCAGDNECNTGSCIGGNCFCSVADGNICGEKVGEGSQCEQASGCQSGLACTNGVCARLAQNAGGANQGGGVQQLPNPLGTTDVTELIARVIKAALGLVGSVGLLMFLYGGFTWMTAGGNEKKVDQGKQVLTWAVLGLIVIFTSYAVLSFVIERLTTSTSSNNIEQNQPQP